MAELSWTSTSYVPGSRFVTGCPLKVSEIVKPGPTVPISFGLTVGCCGMEPAAAGTTATRAASAANPASALPTPVPTTGAVERIGPARNVSPAPAPTQGYWFAARGVAFVITKSTELLFVSCPSGSRDALLPGLASAGGAATAEDSTSALVAVP
jgi:hypothetical protein